MVAWYFETETRCTLQPPGRGYDLFQFGIPSSMRNIIQLLDERGLLRSGSMYHTYWGLDSFVGLPEEDPAALRPTDRLWGAGQFSIARAYHASIHRDRDGAEVYDVPHEVTVPSAEHMRSLYAGWFKPHQRVRMVAGFFNESLTASLARQAYPARYVDIDADLAVSTEQALRWLLTHGLLVQGSLMGYDDFFEAPFLRGGESLAHLRVSREFEVEFELLTRHDLEPDLKAPRDHEPEAEEEVALEKGGVRRHDSNHVRHLCRQGIIFRVVSVGVRADPGIPYALVRRACHTPPLNALLRVPSAACMELAKRELDTFRTYDDDRVDF